MAKSHPMDHFCKNVRLLLAARDMTVSELGNRCGIDRSNLSKILLGKERVTLDRAAVIADALDIGLHELISPKFKILAQSA
jgi:transcriptional regulator with XRE-family HTH domain